ncbi:MAG: hypothetical protein Q9186_004503 [Xanthomendoza sp. 1 TL-2023]
MPPAVNNPTTCRDVCQLDLKNQDRQIVACHHPIVLRTLPPLDYIRPQATTVSRNANGIRFITAAFGIGSDNVGNQRPSPLEPNAGTTSNIDKEAAKLTGRGKALAEAKPIGDSENNELRPIHSTPRKRQKKFDTKSVPDFVQLPRPTAKIHDENPRPFLPISVLNALNEPPPSAALFPPITPSATPLTRDHRLVEDSLSDLVVVGEHHTEQKHGPPDPIIKDDTECRKRLYLRKRTKWSEEETYNLIRGVDTFGVGKWTKILNHPDYYFSEGRNAIDLKDRFRTVMGNAPAEPPKGVSYLQLLGYAEGSRRTDPDRHSQEDEHQPRRKPKHLWSEEEDESLVKGYQKYGFSWKDIAIDPTLALGNRTGNQIRDRFRKRFPELYGEAPPPLKDSQIANLGAAAASKATDRQMGPTGHDLAVNGQRGKGSEGGKARSRKVAATQSKQTASASASFDINGLLNSDDGQIRQASFRSDDWEENVTLAPLLWEDLCTKPMFDLD